MSFAIINIYAEVYDEDHDCFVPIKKGNSFTYFDNKLSAKIKSEVLRNTVPFGTVGVIDIRKYFKFESK
jgi:hypothetical protein